MNIFEVRAGSEEERNDVWHHSVFHRDQMIRIIENRFPGLLTSTWKWKQLCTNQNHNQTSTDIRNRNCQKSKISVFLLNSPPGVERGMPGHKNLWHAILVKRSTDTYTTKFLYSISHYIAKSSIVPFGRLFLLCISVNLQLCTFSIACPAPSLC